MSNSYDEIKKLLKASNNMLYGKRINESKQEIKKIYGMINEQDDVIKRINPMKDIESEIQNEYGETGDVDTDEKSKEDIQQSYRISGNIIALHGKEKKDIELTINEKKAFQETIDEFMTDVTDLVEFETLNVYKNDVEWGGKIVEFDIEFYFTIGENNGIYINGTMIKVDDDYSEVVTKLKTFYEKFKLKWSKILADRKKVNLNEE
jgi:hypothetical protein